MRATPREATLAEYLFRKAGIRKGGRIMAFVMLWTITSAYDEGPIGLERYMAATGEKERTAYRDLADFKSVFPHLKNPQPIADQVIAQRSSPSAAGALPVALVLG